MSVPSIIILSPPPRRHSDSGRYTEKDQRPVAGRPGRPDKRGECDSSSAWNFNFNNGKENWNNRNNSNNNRVFGVRSRR